MMYDAVAYAMRYWFIFVVLGILIAMIVISVREIREKRVALSEIASYLGYVEIVGGPDEFLGDRFGIREQTTIGSSKKSDIIIQGAGLARSHATIYKEGDDIMLRPQNKASTKINNRRAINAHALKTGDIITVGKVELRVYLKKTRLKYDS